MADEARQAHKTHKAPRAGRKAEKKDAVKKKKLGISKDKTNNRAFAYNQGEALAQKLRRTLDMQETKLHAKIDNRTYGEPPPKVVAVVGPPGSGKTTLIKSLVKHYTKNRLTEVQGPVTIRTGMTRITLFECPTELNAMIDLAKVADLVLLLIDASYGFEMESFEFFKHFTSSWIYQSVGCTDSFGPN